MKRNFPFFVILIGIPAILSVWLLAIRLVWEQTVWTWERGAQMIGFSIIHSTMGLPLLLAVLVSLAWPVIVLITAAITRNIGGTKLIAMIALYCIGWGLISVPYGLWQRLFISKFNPTQKIELMIFAVNSGDYKTVRAFLNDGVSVNSQGHYGTALHAAAFQGDLELMKYLISKGADINALNPYGDSPMANAIKAEKFSNEAQSLLIKYGGILIQGTKEQCDRVIEQQSREDFERILKSRPTKTIIIN